LGVAAVSAQTDPDLTHLPVGDGNVSTEPQVGYIWSCQTEFSANAGGAGGVGAWMSDDGTFDYTAKAVVDGDVAWDGEFTVAVEGENRLLAGNSLPTYHTTGTYPISSTDDAYQVDRNPNTIQAQVGEWTLSANPTLADSPSCLPMGAIGVMLSGSVVFNALDGQGRDAVAHETLDHCQGHPQQNGHYHYHNLSDCVEEHEDTESGHSSLMGYVLDGFGIYGYHGEDGEVLTSADLDECHGHTHTIEWDGQMVEMYHYHATYEYPYTIGCFRGTAITLANDMGAGGGRPPLDGNGNPPPMDGNGNPPPPPAGRDGTPPPANGG